MTKSEYQELVEFLGPKLDAIENRMTRVEVLGEENRHQLRIVAEGVGAVWSEVKAVRSEMDEGFIALRSEMAKGFGAVWTEFETLRSEMAAGFDAQGRLIQGLGSRVGHLEA